MHAVAAALVVLLVSIAPRPVGANETVSDGPPADPAAGNDLLPLRHLGSAAGLPQMTVFALAQDADGYVYAGTQDGLARWDGRRFDRLPIPGVSSDWVTHLHADSERLWIGSDLSGLYWYHNGHWQELRDAAGQRLPAIEAIAGAARGGVWVGTPRGLMHCSASSCTDIAAGSGLEVAELLETGKGQLWVGTSFGGLYRLDLDANGELQRSGVHLTHREGLPNNAIRALLLDDAERLWIGTGRGLARWDGAQMRRWVETGTGPLGGVFALRSLPDGSILAALWGAGLAQFRPDDGYRLYGLREGIPDSYLRALLVSGDEDDPIIWLGSSSSGALRLESGRWHSYDERHGLPQRVVVGVGVLAVSGDAPRTWAGTLGGAVQWRDGQWSALLPPPYENHVVYAAVADDEGRRFYGTSRGVLVHEQQQWRLLDSASDGIPGASVENLLVFGDGVWIGTNHGLARFAAGRVTRLHDQHEVYADTAVRAMAALDVPGRGRRVLIGSGQYGALLSDGASIEPVSDSCKVHKSIYDVELLRNGEVWLGTRKGAVRLRWIDGVADCQLLVEPGGATTVYEIAQDRQGRVYLFGYDGVRRFDDPDAPAANEGYRRFGMDDGLPSLEFNRDAMLDGEGRIWAANADGLVVYEPELAERAPRTVSLRLQVTHLGETPLQPGARLPAQHGDLEFRPRLLSFRHEHRIRYRSVLLGLDPGPGEWTSDGDRRYARMPAGDYRFRVEALDAAGQLHGPVEFDFHVATPWWQHPLSLSAAALALLITGLLGGRLRSRALAERAAELERMVGERTQALELASSTDPLTGAWNRRHFYAHIGTWLQEDSAHGGVLLLLVDIDFFKQINDKHGHAAGDHVLIEVARRLRSVDQIGSELIRWGGEEFLLLLRRGEPQSAHARVSAVLKSISDQPIRAQGVDLQVSCSIGHTHCRPPVEGIASHIDLVIQRADAALYRAKREGRNRAQGADTEGGAVT